MFILHATLAPEAEHTNPPKMTAIKNYGKLSLHSEHFNSTQIPYFKPQQHGALKSLTVAVRSSQELDVLLEV
jgi:hypothetical protein